MLSPCGSVSRRGERRGDGSFCRASCSKGKSDGRGVYNNEELATRIHYTDQLHRAARKSFVSIQPVHLLR
jgi:hypothetical protein